MSNNTKKIRVRLTATVLMEHFEVIEVPESATDDQLKKLVESRQSNVDDYRYIQDPSSWRSKYCTYSPADPADEVDCKATFYPDGSIDTEKV